MKIGISTLSMLLEPFENTIAKIALIDCNCWEIIAEGNHKLNGQNIKKLLQIKESHKIELNVHAPYADLNLASLNKGILSETIKQMKDCITAAAELEAKIVTVHPGYLSSYSMFVPKEAWKVNIESLSACADFANQRGIILSIENMPNYFGILGKNAEELLEIFATIKNLKLTFDVGHAFTVNRTIDYFIEKMKDFIINVHLHNNDGTQDSHSSVKNGVIDYVKTLKKLHEIGYNGPLIIETNKWDDAIESKHWLEKLLK